MGEYGGKLSGIQLAVVRHMACHPFGQIGQDSGMRIQRARRAGNKAIGQ